MGKLDKDGNVRGLVGPVVSRKYRDMSILQSRPEPGKQTVATRISNGEGSLASTSGKVIRYILGPAYAERDSEMPGRLTGLLRRCIFRSPAKEAGTRDLHDADLNPLAGFQLNANSAMTQVLKVNPVAKFEDGKLLVHVPAFDTEELKVPFRFDQLKVRLLVSALSFKKEIFRYLAVKEASAQKGQQVGAQEWQIECNVPLDCVIMVTLSLYCFKKRTLDGNVMMNSKEWSPAQVLGAWQVAGEDTEGADFKNWNAEIESEHLKWKQMAGYLGNSILEETSELARLKKPLKKEKVVEKASIPFGDEFEGSSQGGG